MRKLLALFVCTFVLIVAIASCSNHKGSRSSDIIVGSKNFTEQLILGELLAQQIEATTRLKVARSFGLAGALSHQSLTAGKIDTYVEYTGTAFTSILNHDPITDPPEVYRRVKQEYAQKFGLAVTQPLGFENTFAMIVRGKDAQQLNVHTLSQAAQYAPQWQAGVGYEFLDRKDGFQGLAQTYGLHFAKPPQALNLGLMYRALVEKKVDMVAGDSTNGLIQKLNLVVLKDDKKYFPPYQAVPIVRQEKLQEHPELSKVFEKLGGMISEKEMQHLNYQVVGEFRKVEEVVGEFLQSKGLRNKTPV